MNLQEKITDLSWRLPSGLVVLETPRLEDYLEQKFKKAKCTECGASLKQFWHRITPGLVMTLVKVYARVSKKGRNIVDKKELSLSHSEYGNFQKLRFHALIAKYKVDGEWLKGSWSVTKRGGEFLKGQTAIPARVKTFRNKVVDHDPKLIDLRSVMKRYPTFEVDFEYDIFDQIPIQEGLL